MKIHAFPFSPRKGTPAAEFDNQIPPDVRKDRMRRLAVLEGKLAVSYYQSKVGQPLEVLVERTCSDDLASGWVRGTDRHYIPVELPGSANDVGRFRLVRAEQAFRDHLRASV